MGRTKRACHLHLIFCTWDAVITYTPITVFFPFGVQKLHPKWKEIMEVMKVMLGKAIKVQAGHFVLPIAEC